MFPERFKPNDAVEQKVLDSFLGMFNSIDVEQNEFFDDGYECFVLGDVLFALKADAVTNVIRQEVYRTAFFAIHQLFTRPGTFEFYLSVFRAVWGDDVDVEFTIPAPGVLYINVSAVSIQLSEFVARRIEGTEYFYDNVVTQDGDQIVFQGVQGLRTQRETNALIREIAPAGRCVRATLVIS